MGRKTKSPESAKELTPEEKIAELQAENKKLASDLKKSQKETAAATKKLPEFEIENEDEDGEGTGEYSKYRFTCPKFNIDGVEYDAQEVVDGEQLEVLAKLAAMKSGIIELIED